jgi:hypothetical protein
MHWCDLGVACDVNPILLSSTLKRPDSLIDVGVGLSKAKNMGKWLHVEESS